MSRRQPEPPATMNAQRHRQAKSETATKDRKEHKDEKESFLCVLCDLLWQFRIFTVRPPLPDLLRAFLRIAWSPTDQTSGLRLRCKGKTGLAKREKIPAR